MQRSSYLDGTVDEVIGETRDEDNDIYWYIKRRSIIGYHSFRVTYYGRLHHRKQILSLFCF